MDITIFPKKLNGSIRSVPSKSYAHRLLICAAFADSPSTIICPEASDDIEATALCLRALGATVQRTDIGYHICPVTALPEHAVLPCKESGSTLRFLLPVAGALGIDVEFITEGRLGSRPLSPLWEEMERHGCRLTRVSDNTLRCEGKLQGGCFTVTGNVSSQFISGLLLAFALMEADSCILVTGDLESRPYTDMTLQALSLFGIKADGFAIPGGQRLISPGTLTVEGDWSSAAFFLGANALGSNVTIGGLNPESTQGDRDVCSVISMLQHSVTVDAADFPDLVPILAVVAAAKEGAVFTNISRLRLKESDRVVSVIDMLDALGIHAEATQDTLTVHPGTFTGGTVDPHKDHRIAMAAAIAATTASGPITILDAQCVNKSYPRFWEDYQGLGGHYELDLR